MKLIKSNKDGRNTAPGLTAINCNQPKVDLEKPKNDLSALDGSSKSSNFAQLVTTLRKSNFADATTMHGMRYIFMTNIGWVRRSIWILIFLSGLSFWCYLLYLTMNTYYEYPSTTAIETVYERKSELPAVTICDLNTLLKSKLTKAERAVIEHIFAFKPLPPNVSLSDFEHLDLKKFFREKGPTYSSHYCLHKSFQCNESLISYRLTDFGLCLTFDPALDEFSRFQTSPGIHGGFYFASVFLLDEWIQGPFHFEDGYRALIHPSGTAPLALESNGIPINPSFITEIALLRYHETLLPRPHGKCGTKKLKYFRSYTQDNCLLECRTEHTLSICGCRMYYMPGKDRFCTMKETHACQRIMLFPPNGSYLFDSVLCGCPQDCFSTWFDYRLTQSKTSAGYSEISKIRLNISFDEGLGIRIFYQDLKFVKVTQQEIYSHIKLLCDIGGSAGLFLGCSLITLMEFLDFIVEVACKLLKKKAKQSKVVETFT